MVLGDEQLGPYKSIWVCDTEYTATGGDLLVPICLSAKELRSGESINLWTGELGKNPPFDTGEDNLFVAYNAAAELGFYLALGWPLPRRVLDLYFEFRTLFNGDRKQLRFRLIDALEHYDIDSFGVEDKEAGQSLGMRGAPFTEWERAGLQDYCRRDVAKTVELFERMWSAIRLDSALLRARYAYAVAKVEREGVPIDYSTFLALKENWDVIVRELIESVDTNYHVHENGVFSRKLFKAFVEGLGIRWPKTPTGIYRTDKETFQRMAQALPHLKDLQELRRTMGQFKALKLTVGSDGRNRYNAVPYGASSGRNTPSATKAVFATAAWLRSLIKPREGEVFVYSDWHAQEWAIAAYLSKDPAMIADYESGDPYTELGKRWGLLKVSDTKKTAGEMRDRLKICALAVLYGLHASGLADILQVTEHYAELLLEQHHEMYWRFWRWVDFKMFRGRRKGRLETVFGFARKTYPRITEKEWRSLSNFLVQGNGAECLRLSVCELTEASYRVCAMVHDAIATLHQEENFEAELEVVQSTMRWASAQVLDGPEIGVESTIVRYPERYRDKRGVKLWGFTIQRLDSLQKQLLLDKPCE
jgi:DNA polymerase I-like protein with 3'-5' exonuclease and polymerase domains